MAELNPVALRRIEEAPSSSRQAYLDAVTGKASPRMAIKAYCLLCMGYERTEITHCRSFGCPLHAYRPYQGPKNG